MRTLNKIGQQPELTACAIEHNIDIVYVQDKIPSRRSKNKILQYWQWMDVCLSIGVEKLSQCSHRWCRNVFSPRARKLLNIIEKIQPRMIIATFNGTPAQRSFPATALPTLVTKQTSTPYITSYLPLFVTFLNNVFIIGGDMNTQIGKNVNNKFSLDNLPNRNGEHLADFTLENGLTYLKIKFQKRKGKNTAKAHIGYILVNKKRINSTLNCEAYSSFERVSSDHRTVTEKIRLSIRRNATQTTKTAHYYWSMLNNRDVSNKHTIALRNNFDALQEISETLTPYDEYENFVNAHEETAAKWIPTKLRGNIEYPRRH